MVDSLNTAIEGLSKGVAGEQKAAPNAPKQGTATDSSSARDGRRRLNKPQNRKKMRRVCRLLRLEMRNRINGYWVRRLRSLRLPAKILSSNLQRIAVLIITAVAIGARTSQDSVTLRRSDTEMIRTHLSVLISGRDQSCSNSFSVPKP